jgi:serine/threonine protein phosphatase PrpC
MLYTIEDIGLRNYQEDRHSICFNFFQDFHYLAVFDGHGDDKVAIFLKLYLKDVIKRELINFYPSKTIEQCLFNAFKKLDAILPKDIAMNSGSTALVIIKQDNILYIANVGDSRVIINNNETAIPISEDHKPSDILEYNRIKKLGGHVIKDSYGTARVNGILSLSRAIGDIYLTPYVSSVPDIYTVKLSKANNYLIAASDGLWDVFDNQELINLINDNNILIDKNDNKLKNMCKKMVSLARLKGSADNITILLLIL